MQASQIPTKFPIPFANNASPSYIRSIPEASQIGIQAGAASLTDGFPPVTFIPQAAGGTPPFGQDTNGILNQITAWLRWAGAGAPVTYDAAFSVAIGGYPQGAVLQSAAGGAWWLSTVDNNTADPDTGGAGWRAIKFGTVAAENIGLGLEDDGAGNLTIKTTTDGSLRLTASGLQANELVATVNSAQSVGASNHFTNYISSSASSLAFTLAKCSTLWNGFCFLAYAKAGPIVLTPNATDSVAGGAAGATYTIAKGATALVLRDDTGNWSIPLLSSTPSSNTGTVAAVTGAITAGHVAVFSDASGTVQDGGALPTGGASLVSASGSVTPGPYFVDTSGGAITLTLPATISGVFTFTDAKNTWGTNNLTINGNGNNIGNTSTNVASTFLANVSDYQFTIEAAGTYWRLV